MLISISRADLVRHAMRAIAAGVLFTPLAGHAYDGQWRRCSRCPPIRQGGKTLKDVRVGYETYGKLNAAGDNAIFVPHFFTSTSHAAGKYAPTDAAPGYWDPIIGAGRPIDTDKYFVISADALTNLNTKDSNVATTGPSTVNPETGKPYGMAFPVVSFRDTVRVHKALVDSLGVKRLHAVAGASGGSIQAMEWAAAYPDFVQRVVHVIGPGFDISPYVIEMLDVWMTPIRLDQNGTTATTTAATSRKMASRMHSRSSRSTRARMGDKTLVTSRPTRQRILLPRWGNLFAIEDTLMKAGIGRAKTADANSMLYTAKANQIYRLSDDEVKGMKAKILFVPAASDAIFPPELSRRAAERYRAQGGVSEVVVIEGDGGHLEGVFNVAKQGDAIRAFLAK
jgi:homoserine O-acetyltransferase